MLAQLSAGQHPPQIQSHSGSASHRARGPEAVGFLNLLEAHLTLLAEPTSMLSPGIFSGNIPVDLWTQPEDPQNPEHFGLPVRR